MSEGSAEPTALQRWLQVQRTITQLQAHDLRNPLAALSANVSFLEMLLSETQADAGDALADIRLSTETLLRLIDNAALLGHLEGTGVGDPRDPSTMPSGEPLDLGAQVLAITQRVSTVLRPTGVKVSVFGAVAHTVYVRGERLLFDAILENLLWNSSQHVRRGGETRIVVTPDPEQGRVTLLLDDDGPAFGPPERDLSREGQLEMKRLGTTRYSRGLGLYLVGLAAQRFPARVETQPDAPRGVLSVTFVTTEPKSDSGRTTPVP